MNPLRVIKGISYQTEGSIKLFEESIWTYYETQNKRFFRCYIPDDKLDGINIAPVTKEDLIEAYGNADIVYESFGSVFPDEKVIEG